MSSRLLPSGVRSVMSRTSWTSYSGMTPSDLRSSA